MSRTATARAEVFTAASFDYGYRQTVQELVEEIEVDQCCGP